MERRIWQRLGKKTLPQERIVDLEANRRTLQFIRSNGIITLENVREEFQISKECARLRIYRLKRAGFISERPLKDKKVYFCTKLGFSKMPRVKGIKKQEPQKIIEKVEVIKKEKESDKIFPLKRI